MRQWTNADPVHWRIYAALGGGELFTHVVTCCLHLYIWYMISYSMCQHVSTNSVLDSLTNVFLDGQACPSSIFNVELTSKEVVGDQLRDGHMDSCIEPKSLAQNSFRLLAPSPEGLQRIRVFGHGFPSCSPVNGVTMYGVNGCYGENVPCEIQMCTAHVPAKQSEGAVCSFTCLGSNYRYVLLDIQHDAINQVICEVYFY